MRWTWIGVDFDGTLAKHPPGWSGEMGEPIPAMVERVKGWLAEGKEVRIFTARVSGYIPPHEVIGDAPIDAFDMYYQQRAIQRWCQEHLGQVLAITCKKDLGMEVLYDDRCIQVERDTGRLMNGTE